MAGDAFQFHRNLLSSPNFNMLEGLVWRVVTRNIIIDKFILFVFDSAKFCNTFGVTRFRASDISA